MPCCALSFLSACRPRSSMTTGRRVAHLPACCERRVRAVALLCRVSARRALCRLCCLAVALLSVWLLLCCLAAGLGCGCSAELLCLAAALLLSAGLCWLLGGLLGCWLGVVVLCCATLLPSDPARCPPWRRARWPLLAAGLCSVGQRAGCRCWWAVGWPLFSAARPAGRRLGCCAAVLLAPSVCRVAAFASCLSALLASTWLCWLGWAGWLAGSAVACWLAGLPVLAVRAAAVRLACRRAALGAAGLLGCLRWAQRRWPRPLACCRLAGGLDSPALSLCRAVGSGGRKSVGEWAVVDEQWPQGKGW